MIRVRRLQTPVGDRLTNVLLADLPPQETLDDLVELLYQEHRDVLGSTEVLLIRGSADSNERPPESNLHVADLLKRVPNLPIHVLFSHAHRIDLSENLNDRLPSLDEFGSPAGVRNFLKALQQEELRQLALETQAILPAREGYWYGVPSGGFSALFIRVGNIQINRANLDVVFFWLIPYLTDIGAIVTDTWSISSIALNASRLLLRYDEFCTRCMVDMISHYPNEADEAVISEVFRRIHTGDEKRVLVLSSAQLTKRFESTLRRIIERFGHRSSYYRFVTVYKLGEEIECEALCDLSAGFGRYRFRAVETLPDPDGATVIPIDPETYYPSRFEEVPFRVRTDVANLARSFFEKYGAKQVIRVHRHSYEGEQPIKHRAVFIDVSRMLQTPQFRAQVVEAVRALEPAPRIIIAPPHQAGNALRAVAADALCGKGDTGLSSFGHPSLFLRPEDFAPDREIRHAFDNIRDGEAVLILDDTCQTGDRLCRYQTNLRPLFRGRIHYLVGVARPPSEAVWSQVQWMFGSRIGNTVRCLEFLLLPSWLEADGSSCPWCDELRFLKQRLDVVGDERCPALISRRIHLLERGQLDGIADELFLRLDTDYEIALRNDESIFLKTPCSQADVFAAVASSIQRLRTLPEGQALSPPRHPIAPVLDSIEYLRQVFTDSVLRASFLRIAKHHELTHLDEQKEKARSDYAKGIITHQDKNCSNLTLEVLYNAARGKLSMHLEEQDIAMLCQGGYGQIADFFGVLSPPS